MPTHVQFTARSKVVSRAQAQAEGLRHYFTGNPCGRGHIARRYTGDKTCVECKCIATHGKRVARRRGSPPTETQGTRDHPAWGKYLCGVPVKRGELEVYARTGKLPYRIIEKSSMFMPGLDFEMADYCVREGMDGRRLTWGIYLRNHNVRVASFLPGFPRVVATLKDLFDAAHANRKFFRSGRPVNISSRQLRSMQDRADLSMSTTRVDRSQVSELATVRR